MFNVSVTAIIKHQGRFLITKRVSTKSKWPSKWTVPGGKLEESDFLGTPTTTNSQWYHVLENCVTREVKEETDLDITNIRYLCNLAFPGTVVISYIADLVGWDVPTLQMEECDDYAWVTYEEAKNYDLIEGILEELADARND